MGFSCSWCCFEGIRGEHEQLVVVMVANMLVLDRYILSCFHWSSYLPAFRISHIQRLKEWGCDAEGLGGNLWKEMNRKDIRGKERNATSLSQFFRVHFFGDILIMKIH